MNLEFKYESPSHDWSVLHVFKKFHEYFSKLNSNITLSYVNSANFENRFQGGQNSPHIMKITNKDNEKYLLVSYWDRSEDFFIKSNGWGVENCVEVITSSGVTPKHKVTPFSYLPYSTSFDLFSKKAKNLEEKNHNSLIFRGYLYGERLLLQKVGKILITDKKISPHSEYFKDLTNNKICLSLNGAGEICNRDMEILSAKSVLLRPKLNIEFYNDLIPYKHYIPFEVSEDPIKQSELIIKKYDEIKNDLELLKTISENGYNWYQQNATVDSNVEILKKIINVNKLV